MKSIPLSIEFSDEAELDFDNSFHYYLEESSKVADSFLKQINKSLSEIKQRPLSFPVIFNNIRKYTVKKFPFVIYYQTTNTAIRISALFHSSRNPQIWNDRIKP